MFNVKAGVYGATLINVMSGGKWYLGSGMLHSSVRNHEESCHGLHFSVTDKYLVICLSLRTLDAVFQKVQMCFQRVNR